MSKFKFGDKILNSDGVLGVVTNECDGFFFIAWSCHELDEGWHRESELTPASDWVKCSERMPEEGQSVTVYDGDRMWIDITYDFGDGLCFYYEDDGRATHWQPLPAPPLEHQA